MKKLFLSLIAIAIFSAAGFTQTIVGSKHDFPNTWGAPAATDQICIYCHTPHDASATLKPLWNHTATAFGAYTVYSNTTMNATVGQPAGISKMCLSCHDGTVAVDSYGGAVGSNMVTLGSGLVGTDLSNDHPVSFVYDAALATADGELKNPTTTTWNGTQTITTGLLGTGGTMECSSCHDVHGTTVATGLLRKSNAASALCLTCHSK